jgi:hypothetical protein
MLLNETPSAPGCKKMFLHLKPEEVAEFLTHRLPPGAHERALNHFSVCEDCRKMVAWIAHSELAVKDVDEP